MAKIELKGKVEKIVRQAGKQDAQVVITVPVTQSIDIPLGAVAMSIQTLQSAMFNEDSKKAKK